MDSQWLKAQFKNNPGKTKAGLAKHLGLEAPAVSKVLADTRQIKAHEYIEMRRFFGLPVDGDSPAQPYNNAVLLEPLSNKGGGNSPNHLAEKDKTNTQDSWIIPAHILNQHTDTSSDKIRIFRVNENRMDPHFKQGEHVVVDLSDLKPSPPGAFIVSDGFGYMIRNCEYVPKSEPPRIKISAANTEFQPQILDTEDFEIIGRVIGKFQWL